MARQMGHRRLPCETLLLMQPKWNEWEHSAVKIACPCPVSKLPKQIAHVFCKYANKITKCEIFGLIKYFCILAGES